MGMSLTIVRCYGAVLPDQHDDCDGPIARLKAGVPGDADDWEYAIERHVDGVTFVHSGVHDYTTPHIAIKDSIRREWHGGLLVDEPTPPVPSGWHDTVCRALDCLEWTKDDESCDPPEVKIGWFVAASYW